MSNVIDDDASARVSDTGELTMYTTSWCGYCARLKTGLKSLGLTWQEVDIELNPDAAEFVGSVNGGNHVVPTVLYADGTTATNPSIAEVKTKLGI
ncbi:mycoredoxin [Gordonia sp. ABSL11-1]|uniref:mycoredoxin n=1 Tax=Gordonia sp. ABSL11-1 TaxID=3053924 RepID=UPI0025724681|nr:mycoredoxin [Gordonia sp. ABSL11-1]MDL9947861.1 mycoredoxin [Gordonia sp. ABSL11-1]